MDSCDDYGEYDVYEDNHNGYDDWLVKGLKSLFASPEYNLWIPMMVLMIMMVMMIIIMVIMIRMIGWSKGYSPLQKKTCGFL